MAEKGLKNARSMPKVAVPRVGFRRLAARALWYATGYTSSPKPVPPPRRPSSESSVTQTANDLKEAFLKAHLDAAVVGAVVGPSVVLYEIKLGPTGTVKKIEANFREIELAVGTAEIRLVSPLRKGIVGLEVPRPGERPVVTLDAVFNTATDHHPLAVGLGVDITGKGVLGRLDEMPHLLMGGATGSGKSSGLNAILVSLIRQNSPEDLKLLLIDPKKVDLKPYERLPHLVFPIVRDAAQAVPALQWACREMDRRYDLLVEAGVPNRASYNAQCPETPLPAIVVVVDELADLMMVAEKEVEESIIRLTQLARAAGIHLVLATQRPDVKVVTGLIKSNMPSRLAYLTSSHIDSGIILDQNGAERLLGRGDALYKPMGSRRPIRIQGPLVGLEEVQRAVQQACRGEQPRPVVVAPLVAADPLLDQATKIVVQARSGSTSLLQRKLKVGHPRAKELIDALEERGILGPAREGKARVVVSNIDVTKERK